MLSPEIETISFYTRDPDACISDLEEETEKTYLGDERRKSDRRTQEERRSEVRFDLNSSDRRTGEGRRKEDLVPQFW